MLPLHPARITGVGSFRGPSSCRDNCFPSASSPSPPILPFPSPTWTEAAAFQRESNPLVRSLFPALNSATHPPPTPPEKGTALARRGWVELRLGDRARLGFLPPRSRGRESQKPGRQQQQAPGAPGVSFPPPTAKLSAEPPPTPPTPGPPFYSCLLHSSLLHSGSQALAGQFKSEEDMSSCSKNLVEVKQSSGRVEIQVDIYVVDTH